MKKNRTKTFLSLHADLTYSYHPSFKCKLKTLVGKSSLDLSDHPEASRLCVTEDGCVGASDSSSAHSPPTCRPDCDLISLNKKLSPAITLLHPQLYICLLAFSPWASPPFVSFLSSPIFPSFLIWTINVQSPQYLALSFFFLHVSLLIDSISYATNWATVTTQYSCGPMFTWNHHQY